MNSERQLVISGDNSGEDYYSLRVSIVRNKEVVVDVQGGGGGSGGGGGGASSFTGLLDTESFLPVPGQIITANETRTKLVYRDPFKVDVLLNHLPVIGEVLDKNMTFSEEGVAFTWSVRNGVVDGGTLEDSHIFVDRGYVEFRVTNNNIRFTMVASQWDYPQQITVWFNFN